MTNGEKIKEIFPSMPINVSEDTVYCGKSKSYIGEFSKDWWNVEYKEPTMEHVQKIDKLAMMHEIYMAGVNMTGEYQGCWVRFKEIEKIVDKYVR